MIIPQKSRNITFASLQKLCFFWLNPIQDGIFRSFLHILGHKRFSSPHYAYPTLMKADTVMLCLKKIEKNSNPVKQPFSSTDIIFSFFDFGKHKQCILIHNV